MWYTNKNRKICNIIYIFCVQFFKLFSNKKIDVEKIIDSKNNMNCSICLNPLHRKRLLPCMHQFHPQCINQWIEINNSCPLCREPIDTEGEAFLRIIFDFYTILLITIIQLIHSQITFYNFVFAFFVNCVLITLRNICFIYCNVY